MVITFDDGYRNIYDNAHPMLLKYAMPYTVFVNPQDIVQANAILGDMLASNPSYVAYLYGEFNTDTQNLVTTLGMVGFGQYSGGIYSGSDFTALPRFPAAGIYGNLRTLKTKINSLAMLVTSSSVSDPVAQQGSVGDFSFTFAGEDVIAQQMGCYYANEALPVSVDGYTVTVTWDKTLPIGRSRVNCTAPSRTQPGRYYWYSQPWFVADRNGEYPD